MNRVGRGAYICAVAECSKPLNEVTVKNEDPFCSTVCANQFYEFVPTSAQFSITGRPISGGNHGGGRPQKYDRKVTA